MVVPILVAVPAGRSRKAAWVCGTGQENMREWAVKKAQPGVGWVWGVQSWTRNDGARKSARRKM